MVELSACAAIFCLGIVKEPNETHFKKKSKVKTETTNLCWKLLHSLLERFLFDLVSQHVKLLPPEAKTASKYIT